MKLMIDQLYFKQLPFQGPVVVHRHSKLCFILVDFSTCVMSYSPLPVFVSFFSPLPFMIALLF